MFSAICDIGWNQVAAQAACDRIGYSDQGNCIFSCSIKLVCLLYPQLQFPHLDLILVFMKDLYSTKMHPVLTPTIALQRMPQILLVIPAD